MRSLSVGEVSRFLLSAQFRSGRDARCPLSPTNKAGATQLQPTVLLHPGNSAFVARLVGRSGTALAGAQTDAPSH